MSRNTSELHFFSNRTVTEYMRDNGLNDQQTRKEFAQLALSGFWRNWSVGTTGYSITHDGEKYVIRIGKEN